MNLLLSLLTGYVSGSVPTAYLLLKIKHGIDIREKGSGNVGAMNSYEVTKSKKIGIVVFIIDFMKGVLPVLIVGFFIENSFLLCASSLCAAVYAHCYSPWLMFKGGRGLATAAGGALLLSPVIPAVWLLGWIIFHFLVKNIHGANFLTTLFIWIFSIIFVELFPPFLFSGPKGSNEFRILVSILFLIILSKHIVPIWSLIKRKQ